MIGFLHARGWTEDNYFPMKNYNNDNDDRPKRESTTKFIGAFISVNLKLHSTIIARLQYRDCNKR